MGSAGTSASEYDNNHDYSDDNGEDVFGLSGAVYDSNNYYTLENGINYCSAAEYPINKCVSYFMG